MSSFHSTFARIAVSVAAWSHVLTGAAYAQQVANRGADQPADEQQAPLALSGYCVVSLRDQKRWQPGDARIAATFDGQQYRFVGARERDIFAAAPESYAPRLGGDCLVTLADTGKRIPGRLEFSMLHGGRLSLFASEESRRRFLAEPKQYDEVDLALGGLCSVSRRDARRDVTGIPATATLHRGLRFMFASAHERAVFLDSPAKYDGTVSDQGADALGLPLAARPLKSAPNSPQASRDGTGPSDAVDRREPGTAREDVLLGVLPAMAGYCPVTLRQQATWVRGRYEFRKDLDGLVFLTAGRKERDLLAKDPLKFVPALGGDCPVTYMDRKERVRGSVFHAAEYQGRLFLFADVDSKALFKASPERYANADLAEDGMCVVSHVDHGRETPGAPEHAAWHRGLVYRFAGPEEKKKFPADPRRYVEGEQ